MLAAAVGVIALATVNVVRYRQLHARFAGASMVERGHVGGDIWQSFLARAGRPQVQDVFARTPPARRQPRDAVADVWAWAVHAEKALPPDAKVHLNVPDSLLYYYLSTLWHPRRVDVTPQQAVIKDGRTLSEHAVRISPDRGAQLIERGYTHIVVADDEGLHVLRLRAAKEHDVAR